ncbi:MAG: histidinol dehydrogenase [Deltaproteobacteria bacterium]|nr:histidinol dehydrogenase [Deltaproteobacteria bacterium]
MAFAFPDRINDRLVPDDVFAEAYDVLTPGERAVIKTAIARMAAVRGVAHSASRRAATDMRQGFSLHESRGPVAWTVVLWDEAYAGPARVLAALVPAMLAGVPDILTCRVVRDGTPFPKPVLAALELAGQELAAECGPEDALDLAAHCCGQNARGRLILLGRDAVYADIGRIAAERDTPLLRYGAPVRIGIAASTFAAPVSNDSLRLAHPDAALVPFEGDAAQGAFSAVFCAEAAVPGYLGSAPLVLTPGNEAYWSWPGLSRNFFVETDWAVSGDGPTPPAE